MARRVEDLIWAMEALAGEDGADWTVPPIAPPPLMDWSEAKIAFFTYNGLARCLPEVEALVQRCAGALQKRGIAVEERTPPGMDEAYELEMAILGADGGAGIDDYLKDCGNTPRHALLTDFVDRFRPFRSDGPAFTKRWAQWDAYRSGLAAFFREFDAVVCPIYTQPALPHLASMQDENFAGFSYTMAWNLAGAPAATVRCGEMNGLPLNVQVAAAPWRDALALEICRLLEEEFGGWCPPALYNAGTS
jgi:amidase